jgi:N-glycosylase/DNA lyase
MKEQKYILSNVDSFEPKHIFECGQCFRWDEDLDGSYTGVVGENVINVQKVDNKVIFTSFGVDNLEELVNKYFDLERDYKKIKNTLSKVDEYLANSIEYGSGIRILNQDLWETIISFIISANNNIPRIKTIINRMSKKYGNKIVWNDKEYYTFPKVESLSQATVEDLRNLGLGFRDVRIYETTNKILNKEIDLEKLHEIEDTNQVREILLSLSGVGPKVADCILLFSTLKRFDVFPIDVWVRRVMNELYIKNEDETKVNKKEIEKLAKEKYGKLEGLAQQYLFYWKRDTA